MANFPLDGIDWTEDDFSQKAPKDYTLPKFEPAKVEAQPAIQQTTQPIAQQPAAQQPSAPVDQQAAAPIDFTIDDFQQKAPEGFDALQPTFGETVSGLGKEVVSAVHRLRSSAGFGIERMADAGGGFSLISMMPHANLVTALAKEIPVFDETFKEMKEIGFMMKEGGRLDSEATVATMSANFRRAREAGLDDSAFGVTTVLAAAASSLPEFAISFGAGGIGGKVGTKIASELLESVYTVSGKTILRAAAEGSERAARMVKFARRLPAGVGMVSGGLTEGALAAAATGVAMEQAVLTASHEDLYEKSDRYKAVYDAAEGMPAEQRKAYAKNTIAEEAANDTALKVFASTTILGAPAGALAGRLTRRLPAGVAGKGGMLDRLVSTKKGQFVAGYLTEATQEFFQEGAQQVLSNLGIRSYIDRDQSLTEGVRDSMVIGALVGGVLGGPAAVALGGSARAEAKDRVIAGEEERTHLTKLPAFGEQAKPGKKERNRATEIELSAMADARIKEISENPGPETAEEFEFLEANRDNPKALAEKFGVKIVERASGTSPVLDMKIRDQLKKVAENKDLSPVELRKFGRWAGRLGDKEATGGRSGLEVSRALDALLSTGKVPSYVDEEVGEDYTEDGMLSEAAFNKDTAKTPPAAILRVNPILASEEGADDKVAAVLGAMVANGATPYVMDDGSLAVPVVEENRTAIEVIADEIRKAGVDPVIEEVSNELRTEETPAQAEAPAAPDSENKVTADAEAQARVNDDKNRATLKAVVKEPKKTTETADAIPAAPDAAPDAPAAPAAPAAPDAKAAAPDADTAAAKQKKSDAPPATGETLAVARAKGDSRPAPSVEDMPGVSPDAPSDASGKAAKTRKKSAKRAKSESPFEAGRPVGRRRPRDGNGNPISTDAVKTLDSLIAKMVKSGEAPTVAEIRSRTGKQYSKATIEDAISAAGETPNLSISKNEKNRKKVNKKVKKELDKRAKTEGEAGGDPIMGWSRKRRHPLAVSVNAFHYSTTQGLSAISPVKAGSGAQGREAGRFGVGKDRGAIGGTHARTYFYVSEDHSIPEAEREVLGVSAEIYFTKLDNLYDSYEDPLNLDKKASAGRKQPDGVIINEGIFNQDTYEELVVSHGFDGELITLSSGAKIAIVYGSKQKIPVVPATGEIDYRAYKLAGEGSIINVGLMRGTDANAEPISVAQALKAIKKFGGNVVDASVHESNTEPTLVAVLESPIQPRKLYSLSNALGQDSIAQYLATGGEVIGPRPDQWSPFNDRYFLLPNGQTLLEYDGGDMVTENPLLSLAPALDGMPRRVKVNGKVRTFGRSQKISDVAEAYMKSAGLEYNPPQVYASVEVPRAERIAAAFQAMEHAPSNPDVKAAYRALIDETMAQWQAIKAAGLTVEIIRGDDPYNGNPRNAILDIVENNHFWVFPTDAGYGGSESAALEDNPLLEKTGEKIGDHELLANDVFRIVHDYFGHAKEGVGFRAEGEENAWRIHSAMYSPLARKAITVETRGQNSWVNYGPYGESNRTASQETTEYAPQKVGLLPQWAVEEGASDEDVLGEAPLFSVARPKVRKEPNVPSMPKRLYIFPGGLFSALYEAVQNDPSAPSALTTTEWRNWLNGAQRRGLFRAAELDWVDLDPVFDRFDAATHQVRVTKKEDGTIYRNTAETEEAAGMMERSTTLYDRDKFDVTVTELPANRKISAGDILWAIDRAYKADIEESGNLSSEEKLRELETHQMGYYDWIGERALDLYAEEGSQYSINEVENYEDSGTTKYVLEDDVTGEEIEAFDSMNDAEEEKSELESQAIYEIELDLMNETSLEEYVADVLEIDIDTDVARFEQWTAPGGSDYRVIKWIYSDINYAINPSHFVDEGVFMHARTKVRSVGGKRYLSIEEIQSDLFQGEDAIASTSHRGIDRDAVDEAIIEKSAALRKAVSELLTTHAADFKVAPNGVKYAMAGMEHDHDRDIELPASISKSSSAQIIGNLKMALVQSRHAEVFPDQHFGDELPLPPEVVKKIDSIIDKFDGVQNTKRVQEGYEITAPFASNWADVALRRLLIHARKEGLDGVIWTTGGQQAARYGVALAEQAGAIEVHPKWGTSPSGMMAREGSVLVKREASDRNTIDDFGENGNVRAAFDIIDELGAGELLATRSGHDRSGTHRLEELFGKEGARKIEDAFFVPGLPVARFDSNVVLGNKGQNVQYDIIMPKAATKLAKKFGVKAELRPDVFPENIQGGERSAWTLEFNEEFGDFLDGEIPAFSLSKKAKPETDYEASLAKEYPALKYVDQLAEDAAQSETMARWFSKAHDLFRRADGVPVVYFHGSSQPVSEFVSDVLGAGTGTPGSVLGHWLARDPGMAATYGDGKYVEAFLVRLANPYVMNSTEFSSVMKGDFASALAKKASLIAEGYDGIYVPEAEYAVVFDSKDAKNLIRSNTDYGETPNALFSLADLRSGSGESRMAQVSETVAGLKKKVKWRVPVNVVANDKGLPSSLYNHIKRMGAEGRAEGIFDPNTMRVYIVADNISPREGETLNDAIERVFAEEVLGHFGLRATFGKDAMNALFDNIWKSHGSSKAVKELAEEYADVLAAARSKKEVQRTIINEYISKTSPKVEPGMWSMITAWAREQLRKAGIVRKWSDNDLINLMDRVYDGMRTGHTPVSLERLGKAMVDIEAGSVAVKSETADGPQEVSFSLNEPGRYINNGRYSAVIEDGWFGDAPVAEVTRFEGDVNALAEYLAKEGKRGIVAPADMIPADYVRDPGLTVESADGVTYIAFDDGFVSRAVGRGEPPMFSLRHRHREDAETENIIDGILQPHPHEMSWGYRMKLWIQETSGIFGSSETWLELKQGWLDSAASIEKLERDTFDGRLLDAADSAYKMIELTRNLPQVMGAIANHGIPVYKNGVFTIEPGRKGLYEIFAPLWDGPNGKNLVRLWEAYAVARRSDQLINETNPDGTSKEKLLDRERIDRLLALDKKFPIFKKVFNDWQAFNQQALDLAVDRGAMSREQAEIWKKNDYVPFFRAMEDEANLGGMRGKKGLSGQKVTSMRLTGSDKRIQPVLENIIMNTAAIIDKAYKNEAMRRVVALADGTAISHQPMNIKAIKLSNKEIAERLLKAGLLVGDNSGTDPTVRAINRKLYEHDLEAGIKAVAAMTQEQRDGWSTFFRATKPVGNDIVSVMIEGKPVYYKVHDPLVLRAVTDLNRAGFGTFVEIMVGAKSIFTKGITLDPGFMAANFMRDTLSAWVVSSGELEPFKTTLKDAKEIWTETGLAADLAVAGGMTGGFYDVTNKFRNVGRRIAGKDTEVLDNPRKLYDAYRKVGMVSEQINRMKIARAVIARGGSIAEAAWQAQDLTNFTRRGDAVAAQLIMSTVPFLNARLQGQYRLWRGMMGRSSTMTRSQAMAGFFARFSVLAAASIALALKNMDDERYEALPEDQKDVYWHIFVGDSHYAIPKPFEVGVFGATLPERMLRAAMGRDTGGDSARSFIRNLTDVLAINPIPHAVKPIIEQFANKSFFTGSPIVGLELSGLPNASQHSPWTSETAIGASRIIDEVVPDFAKRYLIPDSLQSPARIEHLVRAYFGTIGSYLLSISDSAVRATGAFPPAPSLSGPQDIPGLSRFVRGDPDLVRRTRYTEDLYDLVKEADSLYRDFNRMEREGEFERLEKKYGESAKLMDSRPFLNDMRSTLREMNTAQRQIINDELMSPDEKRDALEEITREKNLLLKEVSPFLRMLR